MGHEIAHAFVSCKRKNIKRTCFAGPMAIMAIKLDDTNMD